MGRSIAASSADLERSIYETRGIAREVNVVKGRSFTPGVTCLCCLGGNCFSVGHVISNCLCCCIKKERRGGSKREREKWSDSECREAREHKQEYVQQEREFARECKKEIAPAGAVQHPEPSTRERGESQKTAAKSNGDQCLLVKLLSPQAVIPTRGSESAAGYDLYSSETVSIPVGTRIPVNTGIAISMPSKNPLYARIAPRSGLSVRGLDVGAGVIDPDYRGPIKVLLINNSTESFRINQGDRVAQLILERMECPECILTDTLPDTSRGSRGFGSTGISGIPIKPPEMVKEECERPPRCRKFFNDGKQRCREEYDICGRARCGYCTSPYGEIPFVDSHKQLVWAREFFQSLGSASLKDDQEIEPVFGLSITTRKMGRTPLCIPSGTVINPGAEEEWYGCHQDPFPTQRRLERRPWDPAFCVDGVHEEWLLQSGIKIGQLTPPERRKVIQLLWVWKDLFVDRVQDLPATDLVVHTIPTYPNARPYRAREPVYAKDEVRWQLEELPKMMDIIVSRGSSPWVAKTTWVSKKETIINVEDGGRWPLRKVHTYCQLNSATIKTNYHMKRIELILDRLADPNHRFFFSTDAAYGFYAVPIYPPHAYKTAFNTLLGQYYYLRMPMGLTGAPATYARLKDLTFGPIPDPDAEPALLSISEDDPSLAFGYFFDDDYGASYTFPKLLSFLHDFYFLRIKWAHLTLKPAKSSFFVPTIEPLGMVVGKHMQQNTQTVVYGLRAKIGRAHV